MKNLFFSFSAVLMLLSLAHSGLYAQSCQGTPVCSKAKVASCNTEAEAVKTVSVETSTPNCISATETKTFTYASLARPAMQVSSLFTSQLSNLFSRITNKQNTSCDPSCCIPTCNPSCCDVASCNTKK